MCLTLTLKTMCKFTLYVSLLVFFTQVGVGNSASITEGMNKSASKVSRMAAVMIAGFIIAWSPYAIVSLYVAISKTRVVPMVSTIPVMLAKSSTFYNPIIYAIMNKQVGFQVAKCFN